jgi:DNA-binding HxlR family transcriptional regulator
MQCAEQKPIPCAVNELLSAITRPWTMHILWALSTDGPTRFGALRRRVQGISSRVLTERLRTLEEHGFVYRHYKPTIPPEVTYGLTRRFEEIGRVLKGLNRLARKWQIEDSPVRRHPGGRPTLHAMKRRMARPV